MTQHPGGRPPPRTAATADRRAARPATGRGAARPTTGRTVARHRTAPTTLLLLLAVLLALAAPVTAPAAQAAEGDAPSVTLSKKEAGKGGELTVKGGGWRSEALLMLLICGRSTPERGVIGGTNSCANADGRAVTTDKRGSFSKKLPVAEPPEPCPCVVHVAAVTGEQALVDTVFAVAGHPTAPLPPPADEGRLAVLATTRLEGESSLLTWFGAPPARRLVFTVGNLGSEPVEDPVFEIGTAHGVYAPQWEERQWSGTVAPGGKAQIKLPVGLSAGAHGDYQVSLRYGTKVLAEQPWGVSRPWGVPLFWVLLCLVVPAAVFRIGMAAVDKARPRPAGPAARHAHRTRTPATQAPPTPAVLPWFTQDSAPSEKRRSAPPENRPPPTTKGQAWTRNGG